MKLFKEVKDMKLDKIFLKNTKGVRSDVRFCLNMRFVSSLTVWDMSNLD